MDYIIFPSTSN